MNSKAPVTLLSVLVLSACAGKSGTFVPGCPAYTGDRITLDDGRFVWDRFTDQVIVDEDGNRQDPFPDYPVTGTFDVKKDVLYMTDTVGDALPEMHFVEIGSATYLLTTAQLEHYRDGGGIDECALKLEDG